MSLRCMAWVLYESPATKIDRLVLLAIADECDEEGRNGYPSFDLIAHKARVNRSTVTRSIRRLESGGELLVRRPATPGRGRFNRYMVTMGRDPVALAAAVGWKPPDLGESVPKEWAQDATYKSTDPMGGEPGDNSAAGAENGSERWQSRRGKGAPGASRPLDPLTPRAKRALPGDKARAEADAMTRTQQAARAKMEENAERLAAEVQVPLEDRKRLAAEVREATRQKLGR